MGFWKRLAGHKWNDREQDLDALDIGTTDFLLSPRLELTRQPVSRKPLDPSKLSRRDRWADKAYKKRALESIHKTSPRWFVARQGYRVGEG